MHYLVFVDKNQKLKVLFAQLAKQVPDAEAAANALGDLKDLEQKLEEYVRQSSYQYFRIQVPTEVDEGNFRTRELTGAESAAARGDFLVHSRRPSEARVLLEEALRLDPNLAAACESMGLLHLHGGERAKAVEWFEKAVKLDSGSYLAHYYYGAHALFSDTAAAQSEKTAEQALKKAIELNPRFAPAYAALAAVYSRGEASMQQALEMAVQASRLEPANPTYRLNIGGILLALRRFAEAQKLGETLLASAPEPYERGIAERFLQDVQQRQKYEEERKQLEKQLAAIPREQDAGAPKLGDQVATAPAPADKSLAQPREEEEVEPGPPGSKAVVVAGTIRAVHCRSSNAMDVTLETRDGSLLLYARDFYKVRFFSLTWTPPDPFMPCSQLAGLRVRLEYYTLAGTRYAGEISSVEVLKGK